MLRWKSRHKIRIEIKYFFYILVCQDENYCADIEYSNETIKICSLQTSKKEKKGNCLMRYKINKIKRIEQNKSIKDGNKIIHQKTDSSLNCLLFPAIVWSHKQP